jgi:hypothetical protein
MSVGDLFEFEKKWETDLGLSFPGKRVVFRGKDLFTELAYKSWMELLLLGVTGREFSTEQIKLLEGIWSISTSYPDPRIWNNRISALAGSYRSTGSLGFAAGVAASEANIYGMRPIVKSFDYLVNTKKRIEEGYSLSVLLKKELRKYRVVSGYARPIINKDERIKPIMKLANELQLDTGEHIKLAFDIEKTLLDMGYRMHANIASIAAGLVADQGFTTREYYYYLINCFSIGLLVCHMDASSKKEGLLFPLRCNRISYEGVNSRHW